MIDRLKSAIGVLFVLIFVAMVAAAGLRIIVFLWPL